MKEKRITKQELQKIYGVDRTTIENWIKNYNFPMIIITSHSKYIKEDDLLEWENSMKISNKMNIVLDR